MPESLKGNFHFVGNVELESIVSYLWLFIPSSFDFLDTKESREGKFKFAQKTFRPKFPRGEIN